MEESITSESERARELQKRFLWQLAGSNVARSVLFREGFLETVSENQVGLVCVCVCAGETALIVTVSSQVGCWIAVHKRRQTRTTRALLAQLLLPTAVEGGSQSNVTMLLLCNTLISAMVSWATTTTTTS